MVDDEPDLRFLLRDILESAGHEVVEAGNGVAALDRVAEQLPDLVVTDVMMPVMNGAELIRRLRTDPVAAGVPIVCVSGNVELSAGADAAVAKPFRAQDVLEAVDELVATGSDAP